MNLRRIPIAPLIAGSCFVACLGLTAVAVGRALSLPADGTVVQASDRLYRSGTVVVDNVLDASTGIRAGDVITAVNGRPVGEFTQAVAQTAIPSRLVYSVAREGVSRDVTVVLHPAALGGLVAQIWPSLGVLAAFVAVGCFVFVRRPHDAAAQDLLIIAGLTSCGTVGWLVG